MVVTRSRIDLERFHDEGYLIVEDLLDVERDLGPAYREYDALLDTLATRWAAQGKLTSDYAGLPFLERFKNVLVEGLRTMGSAAFQPFDISLPISGRMTESTPIYLGPGFFNLMTSRRLIDAVEAFIGPEITSNPVQHVRIKPPERLIPQEARNLFVVATKWHQDQGVGPPEADESDILTVWIPMNEATLENGCLCVVPKSHVRGLATFCPGVGIPEAVRGTDFLPLPMKPGSVLFVHRTTIHSSMPNVGNGIRWSFDMRYQPTGTETGRPIYPDFVVRSRQDPASEIRDPEIWANLWRKTRTKLAAEPRKVTAGRWTGLEEVCA